MSQGLDKLPPGLQQIDRTYVLSGRRKFIYFGGCDYFRLASHPTVIRAAHDGLDSFGLNVAASRKTTGNHRLYERLELELKRFFRVEAALLVSSGYAANLAVAESLRFKVGHAFIDERAHASLRHAALFLDCPVVEFKHRDPEDFRRKLRASGPHTRPILLTDGLFAHDGGVAPLRRHLSSLPRKGIMLLDDAHGAGVLGETGKGTVELEGVNDSRIIQTITLSKAFGAYGGAVLGSKHFVQIIRRDSLLFAGNTPVPLPLANAAFEGVSILRRKPDFRDRLRANVLRVKTPLREMGWSIPPTPSPIVSVALNESRKIDVLRRALLKARIFPSLIHYPGGPPQGYFRFAISSEHTSVQLDRLAEALTRVKRAL